MSFVYPADVFDYPRQLMALLGSFWSRTHADVQFIEDRCQMRLDLMRQWHDNLMEAVDCVSRLEIPVYHKERFAAFLLLESELAAGNVVAQPASLHDVYVITDRVTNPTVIWHKDVDFTIDGTNITFVANPFETDGFTITQLFADGDASDRQLVLWLNQPEYDWTYLYDHFGYILGITATSSENYKQLINAVMDAIVAGTSLATVEEALAAIYDVPLIGSDDETVEDIRDDGKHQLVITNAAVYKCARTATIIPVVGDVLPRGYPITAAVSVYDLQHSASLPALAALSGITVPASLVAPSVGGALTWSNSTETVVVTGPVGSERVEWVLGGDPVVVAAFWDEVHARRTTYGDSLYELMTASGPIPATVNPMEFLLANVFRNNVLLVVVDASSVGDNAMTIDSTAIMRLITPPHSHVLIITV
jgi:hypothetical protein